MEALTAENQPKRARLRDLESRAGMRLLHCSICSLCRLCCHLVALLLLEGHRRHPRWASPLITMPMLLAPCTLNRCQPCKYSRLTVSAWYRRSAADRQRAAAAPRQGQPEGQPRASRAPAALGQGHQADGATRGPHSCSCSCCCQWCCARRKAAARGARSYSGRRESRGEAHESDAHAAAAEPQRIPRGRRPPAAADA